MPRAKPNRPSVEDRLDIIDLMSRYSWALDTGDVDAFVSLFAPDGVWQPPGRRAQGAAEITAAVSVNIRGPDLKGKQHHIDQIVIEGDNSECVVTCYYAALQWEDGTERRFVSMLGYYRNRCVKIDGVWYFKEMVITKWSGDTLPWKGLPAKG